MLTKYLGLNDMNGHCDMTLYLENFYLAIYGPDTWKRVGRVLTCSVLDPFFGILQLGPKTSLLSLV